MISYFSKFMFKILVCIKPGIIWTDLLEKWAIGIANLQHEKDLGVSLIVGPGGLNIGRAAWSSTILQTACCVVSVVLRVSQSTGCCWRLLNWYAGRPRFGLPAFPAANCSQLFLVLSIHYVCCSPLGTSQNVRIGVWLPHKCAPTTYMTRIPEGRES